MNESDSSASAGVQWQGVSTNLQGIQRLDGENANSLLRAAVESANDAIIITEANLNLPGPRIEYVNAAFTRMTGYGIDEVIGKTPRILQGPRTDKGLLRRLRADLEHSQSFHGETVNYRKDGTEYYVEWRITPLTDDTAAVVKWVAIQRDVTPRVLAEQERTQLLQREQEARAEAERQSRMKDEFLATLSHELRTPLNAIVGWSQVLARGRGQYDATEGLSAIERNARAQAKLIDDLLDMSRIITGKIRLDIQRLDLGSVIDAALAAVKHAAEQKSVKLQVVVDPLAGPIAGDPNRLQQVIWNLASNAVKFTESGGRVQVLCERVNSHVEISVSDTGIGIAPEFLPHVFERFRQADATSTRSHGGLGLGLAIAKHIVELHGGQVRAKSPGVGQGSTFVIALPVSIVRELESQSAQPHSLHEPESGADCPPTLRGVKVLVVDDEPDTRNLMQAVLNHCEARVTTAATAAEALRMLDYELPDVLISDIGMPNDDGYQLIRAIRARSPRDGGRVPAVAITAFARSEDRRKALRAGFDMHVPKPIDPDEVVEIVARLAMRAR